VLISPETLTGIERADSKFDRAEDGIVPGVAAGTLTGLAAGSATCSSAGLFGPIAYAGCVTMSGLIGAVAGGIVGGSVYGTSGLSEEDTLYVNEALSFIDQNRDFQQELHSDLKQRLPKEMLTTSDIADVQVLTVLTRINFIQRSEEEVQIETIGVLVFNREIANELQVIHTINFDAKSQKKGIEDWLDNGGEFFGVAITNCLADLAEQMSSTLLKLRTPTATGEIG
jgi:hypothetical protein